MLNREKVVMVNVINNFISSIVVKMKVSIFFVLKIFDKYFLRGCINVVSMINIVVFSLLFIVEVLNWLCKMVGR